MRSPTKKGDHAMTKRYGLFGGTFDPIHNGHLALVRTMCERLALDGVVLMPTHVPPHKIKTDLAPAAHRLEMCRLAAADDADIKVSDWEIRQGGASFTADTLDALRAQHPQAEWYLFVGADMFMTLETWWRFADIAAMATLCTVPRDDVSREQLLQHADRLAAQGARCVVADMPKVSVSSTEIRRRVRAGEPLGDLVPPCVEEYIMEEKLYTGSEPKLPTDEQIVEILRRRLKPKRFVHSLAVAEEAVRLARRYGADPAKAKTAGLLHDIMKNTDPADQLQILSEFGILLTDVERGAEKLYHAMSGAAFIEHILEIHDRDILDAVRYHTTARAGMSVLSRVIYLADFTSADRKYDDVDVMRRLVDVGMDEAMEYALTYTIRDLLDKGQAIHPDTMAAYNELMLARKAAAERSASHHADPAKTNS